MKTISDEIYNKINVILNNIIPFIQEYLEKITKYCLNEIFKLSNKIDNYSNKIEDNVQNKINLVVQRNDIPLKKSNATSNSIPSVTLGGKKYKVTHYEQGAFAYLKIKDGGATVAKANQAYIIGVYNTTKKLKKDGKEQAQSVGMYNTVVEDLAKQLKGQG